MTPRNLLADIRHSGRSGIRDFTEFK